jgi:hypothetical protein
MYVCTYIHMYMYMYTYIYTRVYIFIYVHTLCLQFDDVCLISSRALNVDGIAMFLLFLFSLVAYPILFI